MITEPMTHQLSVVARAAMDAKDVSEQEMADAIAVIADTYVTTRRGLSMRGVRHAPDWFEFETALWELSERIRDFLTRRRDIRGKGELLDTIARIVSDRKFGKGRQNFLLLLGRFGGSGYKEVIAPLLEDPDVAGHAVKALNASRASGFEDRVRLLLLRSESAWVKSAARRYLRRWDAEIR